MRTSLVYHGLLVSLAIVLVYYVFVPSLSADSWPSFNPDYHLGSEKYYSAYEEPSDRPLHLVFHGNGLSIFTFRSNGSIEEWDLTRQSLVRTFQSNSIFSYVASMNSFVTKNAMDNVEIRSLDSGQVTPLARDFYIHSAVDGSGRLLLLSIGGPSLEMWKLDDKMLSKTWDAHRPIRNGVAISTDGKYVAAAEGVYDPVTNSHQTTVELWNVKHKTPRLLFNGVGDQEAHGVWSLEFSPDASMIAVDSHVNRQAGLTVWGTGLGNPIFQVRGLDSHWVRALAFSPEGKFLASGDEKGRLILWSLKQQRAVWEGTVGEQAIHSITFSPDGQLLAAGIQDSTIQVWDIALSDESLD
ncbi:MAG: hypothetical protein NPIRA04_25770 [Nitrospirales bacterium]|nr:MAG: hypothetical protein NPIRA04_25770 [Nitrospirales bacterium]